MSAAAMRATMSVSVAMPRMAWDRRTTPLLFTLVLVSLSWIIYPLNDQRVRLLASSYIDIELDRPNEIGSRSRIPA